MRYKFLRILILFHIILVLNGKDYLRKIRPALFILTLIAIVSLTASYSYSDEYLITDVSSDDTQLTVLANEKKDNDTSLNDLEISPVYDISNSISDSTVTTATNTQYEPTVITDITPPVAAVTNFSVYLGDSVRYKKHITVSDNSGEEPSIEVDSSAVDIETPGSYPVIYTISDNSGNQTSIKATISVLEKPIDPSMEEYARDQARKILNQITNSSMDKMQKAYAIYYWTKHNITYTGDSDKSNYIIGARDGFIQREGDCYTYYSVAKIMLEEADIDNVDIRKHRDSDEDSRHYWLLINVGTGWYHFDSTPYRQEKDNFFMVTDAELKGWDKKYRPGCHNYLKDGLPDLATKSVQDRINYDNSWL